MYKFILILMIGILIFIQFGCGKGKIEEKALVIGTSQSLPTLDPAMHRNRMVQSVLRNIYDCLTTRDADMKVAPQLAESWEMTDDLTWKFYLRKGVKFHNGDSLTSEDVKFSLDRIIKPNMISGRSSHRKGLIDPVEDVEIIDDHTLLIKTSEPWAILPTMLTFIDIVPKKYVQEKGDDYFASNPVGTSAFKLGEWVKGERLVLKKFDDYYGEKAKVDTVIFRPIPEPASRISSLKAGECQIITNLPSHLIDEVDSDPRTLVLSSDGTRSFFIGMNVKKAPFDNPIVRKAMNHAINTDLIISSIMKGMAINLPGPLVPGVFGYNENLEPYKYDSELAKELLKKAGRPDGFKVEIDADYDTKEIAEAISAEFAKIGVTASIRVWELGVLRTQLESQNRSMFIFSWGNASLDPEDILIPVFRTDGRANYMGYSNPEVDKALKEAQIGLDSEIRKQNFIKAQKLIHDDMPVVFLFSPKDMYGVRKSVAGWKPTPDGRIDLHGAYLVSN